MNLVCPKPFSVRIFLQDGHADGVKIVARSKWPGRALVIPRDSLTEELKRPELDAPALYILVGDSQERDLPALRIGAADPVCHKLEEYTRKENSWNRVLIFASKDNNLNLAQVKYLASRLLQLAQESKKSSLQRDDGCETHDNVGESTLSATELAEAKSFLEHILSLCPVLGLYAFETLQMENNSDCQ